MRGLIATLLAVALLSMGAGCGGDGGQLDRAGYEESFREVVEGEGETDALAATLDAVDGDDPEVTADAFEQLGELAFEQSRGLAELRPPDEIAEAHDGYVALLERTGDLYIRVSGELRGERDPEAIERRIRTITSELARPENSMALTEFTRALEENGYDLGFGGPAAP